MKVDEMWYKGVAYPVRWINIGNRGERLVAPITLEQAVINKETGNYNRGGEALDSQIYYYCDNEEWKLSDEELLNVLKTGGV